MPHWHRQGWRLFWRWRSRHPLGRPRLKPEVRSLIATMAGQNQHWGTERIRGELLKLGISVSARSIRRYRRRGPAPTAQPELAHLPRQEGARSDAAGALLPPVATGPPIRFSPSWMGCDHAALNGWLVVTIGGRIVGSALALRVGDAVKVDVIALEPDVRRTGIGRRLMERIELEATRLGARGIYL